MRGSSSEGSLQIATRALPIALRAMLRISYGMAGLVVGNCVLGVVNLGLAVKEHGCPRYSVSDLIAGGVEFAPFIFGFSLIGWLLLGLPFTLFVPSRLARRIHPVGALLIGGILGPLSWLLLFGRADLASLRAFKFDVSVGYYLYAATVAAPAICIYTILLRHYDSKLFGAEAGPREGEATVSPRAGA